MHFTDEQYSVDDIVQYVCGGESGFELSDDDNDVELDHFKHVHDGSQNNETLVQFINFDHDESSDDYVLVQNLVNNKKDFTNH